MLNDLDQFCKAYKQESMREMESFRMERFRDLGLSDEETQRRLFMSREKYEKDLDDYIKKKKTEINNYEMHDKSQILYGALFVSVASNAFFVYALLSDRSSHEDRHVEVEPLQ
jgi:hypothetical protein